MEKEVVVVSGARTAIGAFGCALKDIPVVELGAAVTKEALKRAGLRPKSGEELLSYGPDALKSDGTIELEKRHYDYDSSLRPVQVDEVIMGNVLQGGQGQNTARQACIYAGIPKESLRLRSKSYHFGSRSHNAGRIRGCCRWGHGMHEPRRLPSP